MDKITVYQVLIEAAESAEQLALMYGEISSSQTGKLCMAREIARAKGFRIASENLSPEIAERVVG